MKPLQPTLENELVKLRPLRIDDFQALYKVASDSKIWELHQNPDRGEPTNFKVFFKEAIASNGAFAIIDQATQQIIGSSRFKLCDSDSNAIEIGWTFLARAYWGGKYNLSFKRLMIAHAFTYFDYILFYVDMNNFRSQKAVIKIGGVLLDKNGPLSHLCTKKETGLTYLIAKTGLS